MGDESLRHEVESLLTSDERAKGGIWQLWRRDYFWRNPLAAEITERA